MSETTYLRLVQYISATTVGADQEAKNSASIKWLCAELDVLRVDWAVWRKEMRRQLACEHGYADRDRTCQTCKGGDSDPPPPTDSVRGNVTPPPVGTAGGDVLCAVAVHLSKTGALELHFRKAPDAQMALDSVSRAFTERGEAGWHAQAQVVPVELVFGMSPPDFLRQAAVDMGRADKRAGRERQTVNSLYPTLGVNASPIDLWQPYSDAYDATQAPAEPLDPAKELPPNYVEFWPCTACGKKSSPNCVNCIHCGSWTRPGYPDPATKPTPDEFRPGLPAWRRELERLAHPSPERPIPQEAFERLGRLVVLDDLRRVVASGQGEAEVPESVHRIAWPSVPYEKCKARVRAGALFVAGNPVTEEEVLRAIDAAGAELIGGGE